MNKDISLIMKRTLITYAYILFTIFILKLCGLDYFGIDTSSPFIIWLDNILSIKLLKNILCFIFLMLYQHIMTSLILNEKSWKLTLWSLPATYVFQSSGKKFLMQYGLNVVGDVLYLFILCFVYTRIKKTKKPVFKRTIVVSLVSMLFQLVSYATRYRYSLDYVTSLSINVILTIDYFLLMVMSYKLYFMKGDVNIWEIFQEQVGSSLQKLTSLKSQLKQFQTKYSKTNKKEKFEITLYLIFSLIWNIFTISCVIFVATLNKTVIECIFIISSFWINKHSFGKPFHLRNAMHCFIISNLTYYCLNRITIPSFISILVPILLGIILAWFTSKLVKPDKKSLYRGMSEDELKSKLDKINADPIDYKICKLYYVDGYSEIKVANKTFYSIENIKKRKRTINDKLKGLII